MSQNVSDVLFSTAFETDKVCGIYESSYNAASYNTVLGGYLYQTNLAHNFSRPVFCDALFSTDGTNWFPSGQGNGTDNVLAYSDSSNIYFITNADTGTIYYKLVCTWINNYDTTNPLITFVNNATNTNITAFDSRQNYQKIAFSKIVNLANPGLGNIGTCPITHNLGYAPNYKLFFNSLAGQVWPSIAGGTGDFWLYEGTQYELWGVSNTSTLTLYYDAGSGSDTSFDLWYRIYYD